MKRRYKSKESPFQTEKVIKKIEYMSQFEGLNDREIAEKFHCCRATINRVRRNNNIAKCNIMNKKDKYFICCFCGEKVYVKRRDLNSFMCRKCENKYNKHYRKVNPEIYKANHSITEQRRRERTKNVISNFTNTDWKKCKEFFNNECAYCGRKLKNLTQDHFIPLSKGGNYTKDNIVPACRNCNCRKHNKDFNTWYKEQKFYSEEKESKIINYLSAFK